MPVSCIHQVKDTSLCKKNFKFNPEGKHKKLSFRYFTSKDTIQVRDAIILRKTFDTREYISCLVLLSHSVSQFTLLLIALE